MDSSLDTSDADEGKPPGDQQALGVESGAEAPGARLYFFAGL